MQTFWQLFLRFSFIVLLFAPAATSRAEKMSTTDITALVEKIRGQKHNAGLAVALFNSHDVLHLSTHGYADVATKRPITADSLFMIGSTTKAMTATAAGFLVQEGKLSWDAPVRSLVPEFQLKDPTASQQATLRDLLLHRTGLPRHDFAWLSRSWTSRQYLSLLPLLEPSAAFRSTWQYQNIMYMVSGLMVGAAAQKSWEEVIQEKIFNNLKMHRSRSVTAHLQPTDDVTTPHGWNGETIAKIPARNIDGMGPAGSVHSSITDMITWVQFNLRKGQVAQGTSLDADVLSIIHAPQMFVQAKPNLPEFNADIHYGFGWMITRYRNTPLIMHGGGIDGYLTSVAFLPEKDLGLVVLTNGGDLNPDVIAYSVIDAALKAPAVDWLKRLEPPKSPPKTPEDVTYPDSLQKFLGSYSHPAYGTFTVRELGSGDDTYLELDLNGGYSFYIKPWTVPDAHEWLFTYDDFTCRFHGRDGTQVEWLEVNLEDTVAPQRFMKR